jgi:hypothetical protein
VSGKAGGLSGFLKTQLGQTPEPPDQQTPELPKLETFEVTESVSLQEIKNGVTQRKQSTANRMKTSTNLEPEPMHFEDFERKECRLRAEQFTALAQLERRLSRAKRGQGGPRITANTLIRVAVDLLLEHGDELTSVSEADLLIELRRRVRAKAKS